MSVVSSLMQCAVDWSALTQGGQLLLQKSAPKVGEAAGVAFQALVDTATAFCYERLIGQLKVPSPCPAHFYIFLSCPSSFQSRTTHTHSLSLSLSYEVNCARTDGESSC